jgi:mRNA interferase YafQ
MRALDHTARFKRDLRREMKGTYRQILRTELDPIVESLRADAPLADRLRDHKLTGEWQDHRELHVRPDLLLIYRKPTDDLLNLFGSGHTLSWKWSS